MTIPGRSISSLSAQSPNAGGRVSYRRSLLTTVTPVEKGEVVNNERHWLKPPSDSESEHFDYPITIRIAFKSIPLWPPLF